MKICQKYTIQSNSETQLKCDVCGWFSKQYLYILLSYWNPLKDLKYCHSRRFSFLDSELLFKSRVNVVPFFHLTFLYVSAGTKKGVSLETYRTRYHLGGPLVTSTRWPMFTHSTRTRNYHPAVDATEPLGATCHHGNHVSAASGAARATALIWVHRLEIRLLLDRTLLMQIGCKSRVRAVLYYVDVCERSKRCECDVSLIADHTLLTLLVVSNQ